MNDCMFPTPIFQRPFAGTAASPCTADRKHRSLSSTLRRTMHVSKCAGGLSPSSLPWGFPVWRELGLLMADVGTVG